MTLDPNAADLLNQCLTARGWAPSDRLDLCSLKCNYQDMSNYLADKMERNTSGRQTIRRASSALFNVAASGVMYHLAQIPTEGAPSRSEVIDRHMNNMSLIMIGPYAGGLYVNVESVSSDQLRSRLEQVERFARERSHAAAKAAVLDQTTVQVVSAIDATLRQINGDHNRLVGPATTLSELVKLCDQRGVSLAAILQQTHS